LQIRHRLQLRRGLNSAVTAVVPPHDEDAYVAGVAMDCPEHSLQLFACPAYTAGATTSNATLPTNHRVDDMDCLSGTSAVPLRVSYRTLKPFPPAALKSMTRAHEGAVGKFY